MFAALNTTAPRVMSTSVRVALSRNAVRMTCTSATSNLRTINFNLVRCVLCCSASAHADTDAEGV